MRDRLLFVRVCTAPTEGGARVLIQKLQEAGFHPGPLMASSHISLVGVDVGFTIEVPEDEVAEAREFLRSLGASADLCQ